MAEQEETFENTSSGSALHIPTQCSALRKGGHVNIKGNPCKIVEMSTSKTGKHGHAKVHLVALDIFTGKKYEDICPSTHNMDVPTVTRTEYNLVCVGEDGFADLVDESGDEIRQDLKVEEEFCHIEKSGFADKEKKASIQDVCAFLDGQTLDDKRTVAAFVLKAMNKEYIKEIKLKGSN